jgi:hypothetical protein
MAVETSNVPTGVETAAPGRLGLVVVLATISLTIIAAMFVQPRVSRWLNIREAYRDLSHADENERVEAVRRLIAEGENPDEALIALLSDPDEEVRISAARALAVRRPVADRTVDVFLARLESDSPDEAIARAAAHLFYRHAEQATGPITPTELRMITWLRRRLPPSDPLGQFDGEAVALSNFLHRDLTLNRPLQDYFKGAGIRTQIQVAGRMARRDPAFRDEYLNVLLIAASQSADINAQRTSIYLLKQLQEESGGFAAELEARREKATDPQEASRLDRAIVLLKLTK